MPRPTLLFYGEDAGDSYYFWQWLGDDLSEPRTHVIDRDRLKPLLNELDAALPAPIGAERGAAAAHRMRYEGGFSTLARERNLSRRLADLVLPRELTLEIVAKARAAGGPVLLRTLPAPSCARIPWELLIFEFDGEVHRLIEYVDVVSDPPAGMYARRARQPEAWTGDMAMRPTVYVVDPTSTGEGQVLARAQDVAFRTRRSTHDLGPSRRSPVSRAELSSFLRDPRKPARLFYLGHVASNEDQPGATSMLLSDTEDMYGLAGLHRRRRPFSAFDAVEGTLYLEEREREVSASRRQPNNELLWPTGRREAIAGAEIWPMPPRVALIACSSGGDLGHVEPFGLVLAFLNSGAGLVTATRWTLPTDRAFRDSDDFDADRDPQPLLQMALAVDEAHRGDDPAAALGAWQRKRAAEWDSSDEATDAMANSPVVWAAVTTYLAPWKEPVPLTFEEREQITGDMGDGADSVEPGVVRRADTMAT